MQFEIFETAWGAFGMVTRDKHLLATYLPGAASRIRKTIKSQWPEAVEATNTLPRFRRQVCDYYAGKPVRFDAKLDLSQVPAFRREVLEACRKIPRGCTASYADLARAAGKPGASRAVGGAMSHNPLPLVVPCHRVLRSDGGLGGFSSPEGVGEKERMLALEGAHQLVG